MIRYTFGFIKAFMLATPLITMVLMLLALWGVWGKATYADLGSVQQVSSDAALPAKNYLVSGTKNNELCKELGNVPNSSKVEDADENPMPKKIDWEHVV